MMTFDKFVKALLDALGDYGTDASALVNNHLMLGVKGMPLTHQIGLGSYWRKGIHPDQVNMQKLNEEVHLRMLLAAIGSVGGKMAVFKDLNPLVQLLAGVAAIRSYKELYELYMDWQAGFKAANEIGPWYDTYMNRKKPNAIVSSISQSIWADRPKIWPIADKPTKRIRKRRDK